MSEIKAMLKDTSFYRISYIVCLFFCNISFLQVMSYLALGFMFIWGVVLVFYNEKKFRTFYHLRFGVWIAAFIFCAGITSIYHILDNFLLNILMLFHVAICFFIFYGMHTDKYSNNSTSSLTPRAELYSICRFVVYASTICAILGLIFMMCGVSFEVLWIKFIIYENRFTGIYSNPNLLGFTAVSSLFCCHLLTKNKFIEQSGQNRVSTIWLVACVVTNMISLLLCDSNASLVLGIGYGFFFVVYKFFVKEDKLSRKQAVQKSLAVVLAGVIIVFSSLIVRDFCQAGFSVLMVQTNQTQSSTISKDDIDDITSNIITFNHVNENLDSGRFKLIKNWAELFSLHPLLGIGKGNLIEYSQRYLSNGVLNYGLNYSDLHNGYLTLLVCSGLLGFTLFSIFGLRFAKHTIAIVFKNRHKMTDDTYPCEICFLLAYLIYACFEKTLLYDLSYMVMFFWLILGSVSCMLTKYETDETPQMIYMQRRLEIHHENINNHKKRNKA